MTSLTQGLASQLAGAPVEQIAQQLGVSPSQAQGAIATALPLLIGALGNNARQPDGAQALHSALQDHAGGGDIASVLGSVLGGAMGGGASATGGDQGDSIGRMLGHIFGGEQQQATQGLGQANGLGQDKTQVLLRILAPIVLAYLANHMFGGQQQQAASQASGPQVLGDVLGRETEQMGQAQGGGLGDLLGQVLGGGNAGGLGGLLGGILGGGRN